MSGVGFHECFRHGRRLPESALFVMLTMLSFGAPQSSQPSRQLDSRAVQLRPAVNKHFGPRSPYRYASDHRGKHMDDLLA